MTAPVLLVHGIWDTPAVMGPLKTGLERRGLGVVHAMDLRTRGGRAPIAELGKLVADAADALVSRTGASHVDVVAFSLGALATRWYVQRGGGKASVRRFVSISGPHHGTLSAYALPFGAVREMRPNSALLEDLASDDDPFGAVEVHCVYTPFDLMIVPPRSGILARARSVHAVKVLAHGLMIFDGRVHDHVAKLLLA